MGEEPISFLEKSMCYENIFYLRSGLTSLYLYLFSTYLERVQESGVDIKIFL